MIIAKSSSLLFLGASTAAAAATSHHRHLLSNSHHVELHGVGQAALREAHSKARALLYVRKLQQEGGADMGGGFEIADFLDNIFAGMGDGADDVPLGGFLDGGDGSMDFLGGGMFGGNGTNFLDEILGGSGFLDGMMNNANGNGTGPNFNWIGNGDGSGGDNNWDIAEILERIFGSNGEGNISAIIDGLFGGDGSGILDGIFDGFNRFDNRDGGERNMVDRLMDGMIGMMCNMLPFVTSQMNGEMAEKGMVCSEFGCDEDYSHLRMKCSFDGEVCEIPMGETEEFCGKNSTIETSLELNFDDTSLAVSTQCTTYTQPPFMAELGRGCFEVDVLYNYTGLVKDGAMMDIIMGGSNQEEGGDEAKLSNELTEMMRDFASIQKCSGTFDVGDVTCECSDCNEGFGYELTCSNGIETKQCTDLDALLAAQLPEIAKGGTVNEPAVPVLSFSELPAEDAITEDGDSSSAAVGFKAALAAVGLAIAFASF